ncbi:hypothetical protein ABZ942_36900 [Nocardia sp. NPDC046473]
MSHAYAGRSWCNDRAVLFFGYLAARDATNQVADNQPTMYSLNEALEGF